MTRAILLLLLLLLPAGLRAQAVVPLPGLPTAPVEAPARPPAAPRGIEAAPPLAVPEAAAPAGELGALLEVLRDEDRRAALIRALETARAVPPAPAAPAPTAPAPTAPAHTTGEAPAPPSALAAGLVDRAAAGLAAAWGAVSTATDLRGVSQWAVALWEDPRLREQVASLAWKLLAVLGGGLVAEWLTRRLLRRPQRALERRAEALEDGKLRGLRLLPFEVANILLEMLPILVFGAVALGSVGLLATWPSNRVIMETVAISYMAARAVMAVGRVVFAPGSARLRLLPVSDERARYAMRWIRRIALTAVSVHAAAELALFFGLPSAVRDVILRLGLLAVSVMLAVVAVQNRAAVARILAAPPLKPGDEPDGARRFLRAARDLAAEFWHVVAVGWILAAWVVWALEVEGGFERLLWASLLSVLIVAGGKLLDEGLRWALGRVGRFSPELLQRYPGLETRSSRYLPALKGALSALVTLAVAVLLLEAWGLGALSWFERNRLGGRALGALVTLGFTAGTALVIWEVANAAVQRHLARLPASGQAAQSARVRTLLPMLRTALGTVLTLVVALTTLSELGINVAPLLAGAGVVGLAVGFGSQTLVRDVITGIFLLFEDAVAVGDSVTVAGLSGAVEQLSIRSIKLRALDGSVHIVPFSAVTTVTNQTRDFGYAVVDVTVDFATDTDEAVGLMRQVGGELREDEAWAPQILAPLEMMGVERVGEGGVLLRARLMTPPARRWAVGREMNRRLKQTFDGAGIRLFANGAAREGFRAPGAAGEG